MTSPSKPASAGNGVRDQDVWMGTKQAARYLGGISPRTLERWRRDEANTLPYTKLGSSLRARCVYRKSDLDAFLAQHAYTSTSQYNGRAEMQGDGRPSFPPNSPPGK